MATKPQARSEATQLSLITAAENLIASAGLENVTVRAIVKAAGQKNESALQYHFKNRDGLIRAIHKRRNSEVQKKRLELCDKLLTNKAVPELRDICRLMIEPAFLLAQADPGFHQYVKAFGLELAVSALPVKENLIGSQARATIMTRRWLREALSNIDDEIFNQRFDLAVRFAGLSMARHANAKHAFRGKRSTLFLNNLLDTMAGMLAAEVSPETRQALK